MNNCLIIAGEKSGEEHGMTFLKDLKELSPDTHFWGVGGDEFKSNDVELLYHLNEFNAFGFSEVIKKLPYYIKALSRFDKEVAKRDTKVAILIDFQDFNLRLARKLKKRGVKVLYYVAPTAWVWKEWRAEVLANVVHSLFAIFKFEKEWFGNKGVKKVINITHPLWTRYKHLLNDKLGIEHKTFDSINKEANILLLPGSRRFEIEFLLPIYAKAALKLKESHNIKISIVKSSSVPAEVFTEYDQIFDVIYSDKEIHNALTDADLAIAASGTVTLTTALFEVPTVVCYKLSRFNKFIYDRLVKYTGPVSMANIVHGKRIFKELLQEEATDNNIVAELKSILSSESKYNEIKADLAKTRDHLIGDDVSVAEYISKVINKSYKK
jgi:lipid-A-disaccharide synthase